MERPTYNKQLYMYHYYTSIIIYLHMYLYKYACICLYMYTYDCKSLYINECLFSCKCKLYALCSGAVTSQKNT